MKKIALAIIGLSVVTAGYCGVGEETGNTTCYIYKDNKLAQTVKCKYNYTEGASSSYNFRYVTYTAKAFGKIETASDYDEAGDEAYGMLSHCGGHHSFGLCNVAKGCVCDDPNTKDSQVATSDGVCRDACD